MSEKQKAFIEKLLAEKALAYFQIQAEYHYKTGGRSHLPEVEELNGFQAKFVIEKLLSAPRKPTEQEIQHFQNACNKYDQLIQWAKGQGLKVRSKMKKTSILKAISEAGLQAPSELI